MPLSTMQPSLQEDSINETLDKVVVEDPRGQQKSVQDNLAQPKGASLDYKRENP